METKGGRMGFSLEPDSGDDTETHTWKMANLDCFHFISKESLWVQEIVGDGWGWVKVTGRIPVWEPADCNQMVQNLVELNSYC